ncbi:MAG: metallophosphoesterase [Anaerolineae bacterium]|nr:metallophosphoesterase [Anaerolineae bacterium]
MLASTESSSNKRIPALIPCGEGHQFVVYADSCSGVPGALHESTFASVNTVIQRLEPPPEFICFPGDEIRGLVADDSALREQWRYWFEHEMAWHNFQSIPLYHTTGNHTTYDEYSEAVYREVMSHLPQNGPNGQESLSYFVRHDDLLLIFVNTLWSGLGGEGTVETLWLDQTLADNKDAHFKFVFGHHPVFPVNGFSGSYQREIEHENGKVFWDVLVSHQVIAYFCSHILAFDVQIHQGVLQILTAGAGTAHRMPEEAEYLHCVQVAVDNEGLRYQVLDTQGEVREWLSWPPVLPASIDWSLLNQGVNPSPVTHLSKKNEAILVVLEFVGALSLDAGTSHLQTLLAVWDHEAALAQLWIGIVGCEECLMIKMSPTAGRSPHTWIGPRICLSQPFNFQIAFHTGMGAGGIMWRFNDNETWTSFHAASYWGAERLNWGQYWSVGHGQRGSGDTPFSSHNLSLKYHVQMSSL